MNYRATVDYIGSASHEPIEFETLFELVDYYKTWREKDQDPLGVWTLWVKLDNTWHELPE